MPTGSGPAFITNGPGGHPWFTDFSSNDIRFVDVTTHAISSPFAVPPAAAPNGIVTGPDGNLWFTEYSGNRIGVLRPPAMQVHLTEIPITGGVGSDVAVGPEGATYFMQNSAGRYLNGTLKFTQPYVPPKCAAGDQGYDVRCPMSPLGEIAVAQDGTAYWPYLYAIEANTTETPPELEVGAFGGTAPAMIDIDDAGGQLLVDSQNRMWMSGGGPAGDNFIELVNLAKRSIIANTDYVYDFFRALAQAPDGTVWGVGITNVSGIIAQFNADGTAQVKRYSPASRQLAGVAFSNDGKLWFTDGLSNSIGRLSSAGQITYFPIPTSNSIPGRIVLGPDGALWFAESGSNKIGRITTGGQITEYTLPTGHTSPFGIAVPPQGATCTLCAIWYGDSGGIGYITY